MGSACCKMNSNPKENVIDVPVAIEIVSEVEEDEDNSKIVLNQESNNNFEEITRETTLNRTPSKKQTTPLFKFNQNLEFSNEKDEKRRVSRRITTKKIFKLHERSTDTEAFEEVEPIVEEELTKLQEDMTRDVLENLQLINGFDEDTIIQVDEKQLYNKGEEANLFYIIDKGSIEITSEDSTLILSDGDYFGIEALGENQIRPESAKIISHTTLLCLSGEYYRNAHEYLKLKIMDEKITALKQTPLLKNIDQYKIIQMCHQISEKKYQSGSIILSEEESCDRIYIIKDGTVKVTKNLKRVKKLTKENFFGDIYLFVKKPSFFTYSTETNVVVFELPYKIIKEVLSDNYSKIILYRFFMSAISKSERINEYLYENTDDLYNIFNLKFYTTDEVVYSNNAQKNKKICIIISGRLKKFNKVDILAKSEDLFGELIIDSKVNLDANIVSEDITLTLEADWVNILKSFKYGSSHNVVSLYDTVSRMRKIPLFSTLSEIKLFQLSKKMTKENFGLNEEIIKEGSVGDKFYIIKSGKVKVFQKGKFIREMENGSCFGEISLLTGMIRTVTVITTEKTECFVLAKDSFNDVVDLALLKHLQKILALQDFNVDLDNLYYIKTLGHGRFGKVFLVHNQKTFYAIKYANIKAICRKENLMKYYLNEKNLMLKTDHPFIIKLVKTMKTKDFIYFLLEYIDGVPLKTYLDKRKKTAIKNAYEAAFYGAILLCVVNYLHKKMILHRDIKPDNCMIDKNGYLKVIDFGVAKMLKDKDFTNTCCGTPHYLAPEVILGKGYSFSADYWSIGISMFEIFYGYVPFGQSSKDFMDIYNEIINKNLVLPYDPRHNDINNFFKIILSKNLIQRVCNFNLIRSHPFFHQFDFDLLTDFGIKPPFIPESFIDQNLSGGISLLSHINMPFNIYMENNSYYDDTDFNDEGGVGVYEKEVKWVHDF